MRTAWFEERWSVRLFPEALLMRPEVTSFESTKGHFALFLDPVLPKAGLVTC